MLTPRLDYIDKAILRYLFFHHGWLNTNQIANKINMAWMTAHEHLNYLHNKGYVAKGQKGELTYWRANN
jgi:Mn-dependent DtxR family transcriptional regulator